jgi:hypothetical protein
MSEHLTVIARTIDLPHPADRVFDAVNNPRIAPLIDPGVRRWQPDSEPIGVGTRFEIRGKLQWLPIRGKSVVEVWDPPRLAVYESVRPRRPISLRAVHRFEPLPDGRTRYSWENHIRHPGPLGRLVTRIAKPLLERTIADQHRTLAAWLDQEHSRTQLPPPSHDRSTHLGSGSGPASAEPRWPVAPLHVLGLAASKDRVGQLGRRRDDAWGTVRRPADEESIRSDRLPLVGLRSRRGGLPWRSRKRFGAAPAPGGRGRPSG